MPTSADGTDPGGNPIGVLLFVNDGYLVQVEVCGYGDGFAGLPEIAALHLNERRESRETSNSRMRRLWRLLNS
jgi:hypothetical protein